MSAPTLTDRLFDDSDKEPLDPLLLFEEWFAEAQRSEPNDPHAMALATVDAEGVPDIRMVLLNARDHRGFCLFTNLDSPKATQLRTRPVAAFLMHWKSLRRQVRVRGAVEEVGADEADAYFATRARASQIGAHASRQSRPLASRAELVAQVEKLEREFGTSEPVPRPANWSGFRIVPRQMEFWRDGAHRLHDRVGFDRSDADSSWTRRRLYP